MTLIPAYKKDLELLQEMDSLLNEQLHCHIWWLGQSGFLIQWQGNRILLDPYLSDSLTKKYAATDKPHVRMSERAIAPELLTGIDLITSSHNHTDHLDAETLIPILKNNPQASFIIPEANRAFVAERLQCDINFPIGLNDGRYVAPTFQLAHRQLKSWRDVIHGIPAKHNEIDRDEAGNCRYMGYVIEMGPYKFYHSGDTLWFDDLVDILRPFEVDIAFLPINGNDPARKVAGNLDCEEAAKLGKAIGAKCVISCHYDMFAFNTADVGDFVQAAEKLGQGYRVLRIGERYDILVMNDE